MLAKHIRVPMKPPASIPLSENVCSGTCSVFGAAGGFALVSLPPLQLDEATVISCWSADIAMNTYTSFENALVV